MEVLCWEGSHALFIALVAVPGLLFWVIGVPALLVRKIYVYKKAQREIEAKEQQSTADKNYLRVLKIRYGFLCEGYRCAYDYWEIVIMVKKVFIIFTAVHLRSVSPSMSVLLSLIFMFVTFLI